MLHELGPYRGLGCGCLAGRRPVCGRRQQVAKNYGLGPPHPCLPSAFPFCTLTPQACRSSPAEKGKFIKTILVLLQSPSPAVMYECAVTLTSLSSAPSAVRAAANCFCTLLARWGFWVQRLLGGRLHAVGCNKRGRDCVKHENKPS